MFLWISEIYVTGAYVESADELDELGILGQFDRDFGHGDTVHAEISYYIIGQSGVESERLPDEFGCDIVSHLDAAVQYADLLEERPLTIVSVIMRCRLEWIGAIRCRTYF